MTNLPGETIIDIEGLSKESGGRLFQENVARPQQKEQIYIEKTQQISERVGGLPLALCLLAHTFDDQVGTSLDQYIKDLRSHLPKARDKWTEEDRHETLRASFDFTMNNLLKTREGKELQVALSRLSMFIAFFVDFTAAPVLENRMFESNEEFEHVRPKVDSTLHSLWERGLLERAIIPLEEENLYLYRLHPALGFFAKERLDDAETVKENYWKSMSNLVRVAEKGIDISPHMAQIALRAMPDLQSAAVLKSNNDAALMQFRVSKLLQQFGLYDESLHMLERSLDITESLHDLKGKSANLNIMAQIYFTRGDLDKAMQLLQQSLEIDEGLGDLKSKSSALHELAQIYNLQGNLDEAMNLFQQSLEIDEDLGNLQNKPATLTAMASIYVTRGNFDEAMKLYQQSLEIDKELGNLRGISVTLRWIAYIETQKGNYNNALLILDRTCNTADEIGDINGKMESLFNMAQIFETQGELDKALTMFQQVLVEQESLGYLQRQAITLGSIANVYVMQGNLDEAMKLYQQSLEILNGLGNLQNKALVLNNMGIALFQHSHYLESLESILSALEINIQLQAKLNIQSTVSLLIQFRQAIGTDEFQKLWREVTGDEQFPEWLTQPP